MSITKKAYLKKLAKQVVSHRTIEKKALDLAIACREANVDMVKVSQVMTKIAAKSGLLSRIRAALSSGAGRVSSGAQAAGNAALGGVQRGVGSAGIGVGNFLARNPQIAANLGYGGGGAVLGAGAGALADDENRLRNALIGAGLGAGAGVGALHGGRALGGKLTALKGAKNKSLRSVGDKLTGLGSSLTEGQSELAGRIGKASEGLYGAGGDRLGIVRAALSKAKGKVK